MNRFETMSAAALQAMIHVLDLQPDDQVLVVTDQQTRTCGDAFARGAERHGCPVETYVLREADRPLKSLPNDLRNSLADANVVINAIVGDHREVPFRIEWIRAIEDNGTIRLGHSPGIDEDMMVSGPMNVDYGKMLATAGDLMAGFADASEVRITTPAGTDLRLNLAGRHFTHDLKATVEVGANLPCGEIYCAPLETGADGLLIVDGCFGCNGMVPTPIAITVNAGQAVDVTGDNDEIVGIINRLMDTDSGSRTIAELGIGLNPGARLTERMLEAEKAHHTAHIAFGSNEGFPGGINHSTMHIDYLVLRPTMEILLSGGKSRLVMEDGEPV